MIVHEPYDYYLIPRPSSVELARRVVGAKVVTYYPDFGKWFVADIREVNTPESLGGVEEDPELVPGTFWLLLTYPAQQGEDSDTEDLEWDQVFNRAPIHSGDSPDQIKICLMPEDGCCLTPSDLAELNAIVVPAATFNSHNHQRHVQYSKRKLDQQPTNGKLCSKAPRVQDGVELERGSSRRREAETLNRQFSSSLHEQWDKENASFFAACPTASQLQQNQTQAAVRKGRGKKTGLEAEAHLSGKDCKEELGRSQPGNKHMRAVILDVKDGEGHAGQIKSIELQNFMCHEHFMMNFGANLNLICGTNGSGKSAVLQALQCCMGVKAQATGRFKSAKDFVKKGQDQAVIQVTMWNTGAEAYLPEQLGRTFTIERRISRTGGNVFCVKNSAGAAVLKGAKEVEALIDYLNINAANPAVVLTQDVARSFAGELSESNKFEVFMEALQLDDINSNLRRAGEDIAEIEDAVRVDRDALKKRSSKLAEKQGALESMREVRNWKAKQGLLTQCFAWQSVYDLETQIQERRERLRTGPERLEAAAAQVANYRQHTDSLAAQLAEEQQHLADLNTRMQGHQQQLQEAQAEHKRKQRRRHELERELKRRQREVQEYIKEKEDLLSSEKEVDDEYVRSTQAEMESYHANVQNCRDESTAAAAKEKAAALHVKETEASVEQATEGVQAAKTKFDAANKAISDLQGSMARLERASGDRLASFGGERMRALLHRVDAAVQQGKFQRPPIGPIGLGLSLTDDTWAVAVEAALGRLLDAFVLCCPDDERLLKQLARQEGVQLPTTYITRFDIPQHDLSSRRPLPARVTTLLKVLRFEDSPTVHVVKNLLVDQAKIERTVLCMTAEELLKTLRDSNFMDQYRVHQIWARDGSQGRKRGRSETVLGPGRRPHPRLMKDASHHMQQCREELIQAQEAAAQLQEELIAARRWLVDTQQAAAAAVKEYKAAHQLAARTKGRLTQVLSQQPVEPAAAAGPSDTAKRVAELQSRIVEEQQGVTEAEVAVEEALQEVQEAQERCHQIAAAPQSMQGEIEACTEALSRNAEQAAEVEAELKAAQEQEARLQADLRQLEQAADRYQAQLPVMQEGALEVCTREEEQQARARLRSEWLAEGKSEAEVERLLTCGEMERRLQRLADQIERRETHVGACLEDLQLEVEELELAHGAHERKHAQCRALLQQLGKGHAARVRKFKDVQIKVAHIVSKQFSKYMRMRQHIADIQVDYKNKRLVFSVGVNGQEVCRDMKALSGGERSLCTVCFVMALGHAGLSPPFVCLDEFDVFMDPINRRYTLMFLLEFAHVYRDRQFLLFSPQDTAVVEQAKQQLTQHKGLNFPDEFVHVVRMRAARANAEES